MSTVKYLYSTTVKLKKFLTGSHYMLLHLYYYIYNIGLIKKLKYKDKSRLIYQNPSTHKI